MASDSAPPPPRRRWRRLLVLPPVLLGAALLAWQLQAERGPEAPVATERRVAVEVIEVAAGTLTPRAVGYGTVEPGRTWRATAEVTGRIVERHRRLERGRLLPAGTLLAAIERSDFELAAARARAEIRRGEAQIGQLEVRRDNLERSLEIQERAVRRAEADLARQRKLLERGNTSESAVDQAETELLVRREQLQNVRAELADIDPEISVAEADLEVRRAELRDTELDLERTEIFLPFDARVADVEVEEGEYVSPGTVVANFDSIERAEVDAQFALAELRPLIPGDLELGRLDIRTLAELPERLGFDVKVRLSEPRLDIEWDARFERASDRVDAQTRTLGLIVAVDDPYSIRGPGGRPPLTKGMFVEVVVEGRPLEDRLVVPLEAVRRRDQGAVLYLADADDRLVVRPITLGPVIGELAVIEAGLEAGERVVVSDLQPAIAGMRLDVGVREDAPAATAVSEARP
ncbi:MAG: efflux RND transporter periplasmic adaptor subunit [Alphaproteobacteria bacterium]